MSGPTVQDRGKRRVERRCAFQNKALVWGWAGAACGGGGGGRDNRDRPTPPPPLIVSLEIPLLRDQVLGAWSHDIDSITHADEGSTLSHLCLITITRTLSFNYDSNSRCLSLNPNQSRHARVAPTFPSVDSKSLDLRRDVNESSLVKDPRQKDAERTPKECRSLQHHPLAYSTQTASAQPRALPHNHSNTRLFVSPLYQTRRFIPLSLYHTHCPLPPSNPPPSAAELPTVLTASAANMRRVKTSPCGASAVSTSPW